MKSILSVIAALAVAIFTVGSAFADGGPTPEPYEPPPPPPAEPYVEPEPEPAPYVEPVEEEDPLWGLYGTAFVGGAFGGEVDEDIFGEFDLDNGLLLGATIGVFDPFDLTSAGSLRYEAEVSYREQDYDAVNDEVDVVTLLANIWYDFDINSPVVPYVGGGLGVGFVDIDSFGDDGTGFAWQVGGGAYYNFTRQLFFGLNYRYLAVTGADIAGIDVDYGAHQISGSVGYRF